MANRPGSQLVHDGFVWITGHKAEWLELQRVCLAIEAKKDRYGRPKATSITRGNVYTIAEICGIPISNDFTFRRDHDLWSTLGRYLTKLHPRLKRVIRHRECDVAKYERIHGMPKLPPKYIYNDRRKNG